MLFSMTFIVNYNCQECVRREVAEEVGLDIDSVAYKCSQHWPFPAGSLMVGCHATVTGDLPTPDPCKQELEDARWFSRAEVNIYLLITTNIFYTDPGVRGCGEDRCQPPPAGGSW